MVFVYQATAPKVHSVKYECLDPNAPTQSIYLSRRFFPNMPAKIAVTITAQ
jgi:hypothetical protein